MASKKKPTSAAEKKRPPSKLTAAVAAATKGKINLTDAKLKRLSAKNKSPQSWYNDSDVFRK
jgi:hypothetical protein